MASCGLVSHKSASPPFIVIIGRKNRINCSKSSQRGRMGKIAGIKYCIGQEEQKLPALAVESLWWPIWQPLVLLTRQGGISLYLENKFVRGVPRSLRSSVIALLYRSEITVRLLPLNLETKYGGGKCILRWQRPSGTQATKSKQLWLPKLVTVKAASEIVWIIQGDSFCPRTGLTESHIDSLLCILHGPIWSKLGSILFLGNTQPS